MKKFLNWEELLIIAGFQPKQLSETMFDIKRESFENIEFLKNLLLEGSVNYEFKYYNIDILSKPLALEKWVSLLKKIGQKSSGMSFKSDDIDLITLDITMLAIVRQLNRLGLYTKWSCDGHGKKAPFVMFVKEEHTLKCKDMLSKLGYRSRLKSAKTIEILVGESELLDIGFDLSMLNTADENDIKQCIYKKYEEILEDLLMIPGKSGEENLVRSHLMKIMPNLTDEVNVDSYGNILGSKRYGNGPTILLSAHMDIVDDISESSLIIKEENIWRRNEGILGADDRAGVAMILNILSTVTNKDFQGSIKVALTVEEEIGQNGANNIDQGFFADVNYAISLDRRNGSDIVVKSHFQTYCTPKYGKIFEDVSTKLLHGEESFSMVQGGISDLRIWSQLGIESVNLSIGYYNEHTYNEILNISEWHRTFELVKKSLRKLQDKSRNSICKALLF